MKARAARTDSPLGPSHSAFSKQTPGRLRPAPFPILKKTDASRERSPGADRRGDMPTDRGAVIADRQADLLNTDRVEQTERPLEKADSTDGCEAVREAVLADRHAPTGCQNERACNHAANNSKARSTANSLARGAAAVTFQ